MYFSWCWSQHNLSKVESSNNNNFVTEIVIRINIIFYMYIRYFHRIPFINQGLLLSDPLFNFPSFFKSDITHKYIMNFIQHDCFLWIKKLDIFGGFVHELLFLKQKISTAARLLNYI